jgi:hypothetical protein
MSLAGGLSAALRLALGCALGKEAVCSVFRLACLYALRFSRKARHRSGSRRVRAYHARW